MMAAEDHSPSPGQSDLPLLLTVDEVKLVLRKRTRSAVYAMVARGELVGIRQRRPLLVSRDALLQWIREGTVPSRRKGRHPQ